MSTTSPDVFEIGRATPHQARSAGVADRLRRLAAGPAEDPRWARPGLLGLLFLTAVLYIWDLSSSGWANSFYSAAAQAGTKSWKAMLFGSLDAGNVITVDKPPASLWLMEISGRLFGFSSWTMLLPQALLGVGTVALVYAAVKRVVGPAFGLLAGAALAVTPVAVLMFRFNNPDALLTFLLVLAVYAVLRAQESGSTKWLVWAGVSVGFAFLTKTLQAFLILPPLTLVYAATGPGRFVRRLWQLLLSGVALLVSAGWWVAIVQLTPASARPYVGGSQKNSFLELTFGYNGFGRLTGNETGSVGGGAPRTFGGPESVAGQSFGLLAPGQTLPADITGPQLFRAGGPGGFSNGTGLSRMFDSEIGTQISWLLPAALVLLAAGVWAAGRAERTHPARAALLGWGGSLLSTGLVFSYMKGIFHPYYTVALAPLIAAVVGIGAGMLWRRREQLVARLGLAAAVGVTGWWGFRLLDRTPDWNSWLKYAVVAAAVLGAVAVLAAPLLERTKTGTAGAAAAAEPEWAGTGPSSVAGVVTGGTPEWAGGAPGPAGTEAGLAQPAGTPAAPAVSGAVPTVVRGLRWATIAFGVIAGLLGPGAYALATASTGHTGSIPSAGPGGMGGFGGGAPRMFLNGNAPGGLTQLGGAPNGAFPGGPNGQGNQNGQTGGFPQGGTGGQPNQGTAPNRGTVPNQGTAPNGGPFSRTGGGPGAMGNFLDASTPSKAVQAVLTKDASSYTWIAAAIGSQNAAGYQLATGDAVIPIGGFNTTDPAPTLAKFQEYVAKHRVHYFVDGGDQRGNGGADVGSQISSWVKAHYQPQTVDGVTLYDLSATPTS